MADRHQPVGSRPTGAGAGAGINRTRTAPTTSTVSNVRRNLFQSQLTRQPTAPSTVTAGASDVRGGSATSTSSADTLRLGSLDLPEGAVSGVSSGSSSFAAAESDIVVRDKNGGIELLDDPPTPAFDDQDVDGDGAALEHARMESEERQRLSEAVKQHQIDQNSLPAQPEELLEAVRGSLRAKVAALADDNWIYEREDPPKFQ